MSVYFAIIIFSFVFIWNFISISFGIFDKTHKQQQLHTTNKWQHGYYNKKKRKAKNNKNKMQTFICLHMCGCVVNWFCCDCCCCYCCSCCWRRWHWSAILQLEIDIAIATTRLTNYSTTVQQINCRVASIDECECRGEEMK